MFDVESSESHAGLISCAVEPRFVQLRPYLSFTHSFSNEFQKNVGDEARGHDIPLTCSGIPHSALVAGLEIKRNGAFTHQTR